MAEDDSSSNAIEAAKRANRLETVGNKDTMNLHNILYQNIIASQYFRSLYEIKTYHQVIDEIYNKEPFFKGNHASTAFCLLYKLWTLRLTVKQVQGLINHTDSPHIRALGFLYLRYVGKPADLWSWYEPYFDDDEEFQVESGPKPRMMTMGRFILDLLTESKWLGTILPRIPVPIAREIEKKLKDRAMGAGGAAAGPSGSGSGGARGGGGYHDDERGPTRNDSARDHGGMRYRDGPSDAVPGSRGGGDRRDDRAGIGGRGMYRESDRRDYSSRRADDRDDYHHDHRHRRGTDSRHSSSSTHEAGRRRRDDDDRYPPSRRRNRSRSRSPVRALSPTLSSSSRERRSNHHRRRDDDDERHPRERYSELRCDDDDGFKEMKRDSRAPLSPRRTR
ncbi:PRP38 pre-mRNA processing factor 38 domain-containing protein B [Geranomyces variabilis]|nr:PRP38 pre-mRNA processing factor 38 domain-containing protein B [Geranomyces variabilis]